MGIVYADIELSNPKQQGLKPIAVGALVDTSAVTLCIPENVPVQLKLDQIETREVRIAEDKSQGAPYMGPVEVRFQGCTCFAGAILIEDPVLISAVRMEDMDFAISPRQRKLAVNPNRPNIPSALVK